jgi:apolipoprotein N-acyltransferase
MVKKILRNPYFLSGLSAALLRLSFPKPGLWICAWLALVPLFFALEKQKGAKAFFVSFFCGYIFFATTVFWLMHVTWTGMFVVAAYLALYVAVFGRIVAAYQAKGLSFGQRLLFVPALWVSCEFVRSYFLLGFPWALLGNSQASDLLAIQAADITGVYGVSFIVVFVNVFLFEFVRSLPRKPLSFKATVVPVCVVLAWMGYGAYRLAEDPRESCFFKVACVQGNIQQEIKWASGFRDRILKKHQILTEIVSLKTEPDLIVWPETSYPDYLDPGAPQTFEKDFLRGNDSAPLLVGSITLRNARYFNSAILFSGDGKILNMYDKIHLVPFGEYIPARRFFPFLAAVVPIEDFTPGREHVIFSLSGRACPSLRLAALICFEDIFGDLTRRFVQKGADVLVNMTNDAWFGDTSSPYQHMQASVLRAVENRVFVVRSANTGISCCINDTGKVTATVRDVSGKPTFVTSYQTAQVARTRRGAVYTKIGDVFVLLCIFYAMMIMIWRIKIRR